MKEKTFIIKYRYSNKKSVNQDLDSSISSENSESEQLKWYQIDLSADINDGSITNLTQDLIIEILKADHAQFVETNIKIKQENYWIAIGTSFSIEFSALLEGDQEFYEICLLLEHLPRQRKNQQTLNPPRKKLSLSDRNGESYNQNDIPQQLEKIQNSIEQIQFSQVTLENRFREFTEEIIEANVSENKIREIIDDSLRIQFSNFFGNLKSIFAPHIKDPMFRFENQNSQYSEEFTNGQLNNQQNWLQMKQTSSVEIKNESLSVNVLDNQDLDPSSFPKVDSQENQGGSQVDQIPTSNENDEENLNDSKGKQQEKESLFFEEIKSTKVEIDFFNNDNKNSREEEENTTNLFNFDFLPPSSEATRQASAEQKPVILFKFDNLEETGAAESNEQEEIDFFNVGKKKKPLQSVQKIEPPKEKEKESKDKKPQQQQPQQMQQPPGKPKQIVPDYSVSQIAIPSPMSNNSQSQMNSKKTQFASYGGNGVVLDWGSIRGNSRQMTPHQQQQNPIDMSVSSSKSNERVVQFEKKQQQNHHISHHHSHCTNPQFIQTNMTIMYSDPLVTQAGLSPEDPVGYELEIQKLEEFLGETNKEIKLDIMVASLDNLEKSINRQSEILHIMCHGSYSAKDKFYYLSFEDEESKLDVVNSDRFREFFKNKNSNIKLVFFNACHSEEVAKIFSEAGIPYVIAVQSDLKIEDKAALTFSSSFYMHLFSGHSVQQSFESARSSLQAKQYDNCFTCCCAHSHDEKCKWFLEAIKSFDKAHSLHKPGNYCRCPNQKKMIHLYTCEWAHDFLKRYREDYEDYIESVNVGDLFVCCCHTEETPHDESLKFRLIRNSAEEDCTIMPNLPEGKIKKKSQIDFNHPVFQDQSRIFGRNKELYKMYKYLMGNQKLKTKFVAINGDLGSGKTAVAKKVARHLKERGQFQDIIIEDFEKMKTKITKFEQKMRLGLHSKELAYSSLKNKKTLFILDNCDDLIKYNKLKFETTLNDLAIHTPSKFIIITHERYDLKLSAGSAPSITLDPLPEYQVIQLFKFYFGETIKEHGDIENVNSQLIELVKIMPKTPKTIMETVQNITENMDITHILRSFQSSKVSDKSKDYTAFNLLIKDLKASNTQAYDMLLFISLFPHGVSVEDLKFLEKRKKIPHDWIRIMEQLTLLYTNDTQTNRPSIELGVHDLPEVSSIGLRRLQSRRMMSQTFNSVSNSSNKVEDEDQEEDDFDNDTKHEESYRYKKFKNGQYFWMSITRKFDIVIFRIKKFVVESLKQPEYRSDLFSKEMLILEYLSLFSKKLLQTLKENCHHEEKLVEYCSLSTSGIFGVNYQIPSLGASSSGATAAGGHHLLPKKHMRPSQAHLLTSIGGDSMKNSQSIMMFDQSELDFEFYQDLQQQQQQQQQEIIHHSQSNQNLKLFSEDKQSILSSRPSVMDLPSLALEAKHPHNSEPFSIGLFMTFSPQEIFKLHEGNFYSYLNVDDHLHLIEYINSNQCDERRKISIKKNIQDLCVNIPSIHKLLDEFSTCEEQCQQAEQVLDELLKNNANSKFLLAKAKLLFLKISLFVDKYVSDGCLSDASIEDVIHNEEIESLVEEIDKKYCDFDRNEIFTELIELEKQMIVYYVLYNSYKRNKENELSQVFDTILKVKKDLRSSGVKGRINQMLEFLIPELLQKIQNLKRREFEIENEKKDIKLFPNSLDILESKVHLLNALIELEFNKFYRINFENLQTSIAVFERAGINSLMIQTTMVYCKKRIIGLKTSRDSNNLIKLKKEMIDPAIALSKQWKLTSLESDCKKILGEINDRLQHISSNVFQFMKAIPLMMDKNQTYGHIIRLAQSYKRRVTDLLSHTGKELNLKFEIQTIKHFRECLQRGSKFMSISYDVCEEDGIIVEDDQLPLMRKYKEQEMEDYYKMHYDEFGNIEILMLCCPNGIKLKDMFLRIIQKVNNSIQKMQESPGEKHRHPSIVTRLLDNSTLPSSHQISDSTLNPSSLNSTDTNKSLGVMEKRKVPTIIAFQFNQNQKLADADAPKRRKPALDLVNQLKQFELNNTADSKRKHQPNSSRQQQPIDPTHAKSQTGSPNEFEDFYSYYLKEFAIQQFLFEFLTQLMQDPKPEQNSHAHIKRAYNLAQQKMVTETIRICGEDIKDENSFEQVLGKMPELFLSDDWKDSKFEFRKGPITDITSEKPPQNLDSSFLRIAGRKQDIYVLVQKISENCVNIYGEQGIGKTIVAQQLAYQVYNRNIFSDGVYFFKLKQLKNFQYDLKLLMEFQLGQQFSQDVSEYFQSQKNMLLIFDDFDMIVPTYSKWQSEEQQRIQFFEYIFSYINKFDIHYVLVTKKSLKNILLSPNRSHALVNTEHIKSSMHYHELKHFSRQESLNFLDSLLDLENIKIKKILENRKRFLRIYEKAKGHPKRLIEEYCKRFGNPKIPIQYISSINPNDSQESEEIKFQANLTPNNNNSHNKNSIPIHHHLHQQPSQMQQQSSTVSNKIQSPYITSLNPVVLNTKSSSSNSNSNSTFIAQRGHNKSNSQVSQGNSFIQASSSSSLNQIHAQPQQLFQIESSLPNSQPSQQLISQLRSSSSASMLSGVKPSHPFNYNYQGSSQSLLVPPQQNRMQQAQKRPSTTNIFNIDPCKEIDFASLTTDRNSNKNVQQQHLRQKNPSEHELELQKAESYAGDQYPNRSQRAHSSNPMNRSLVLTHNQKSFEYLKSAGMQGRRDQEQYKQLQHQQQQQQQIQKQHLQLFSQNSSSMTPRTRRKSNSQQMGNLFGRDSQDQRQQLFIARGQGGYDTDGHSPINPNRLHQSLSKPKLKRFSASQSHGSSSSSSSSNSNSSSDNSKRKKKGTSKPHVGITSSSSTSSPSASEQSSAPLSPSHSQLEKSIANGSDELDPSLSVEQFTHQLFGFSNVKNEIHQGNDTSNSGSSRRKSAVQRFTIESPAVASLPNSARHSIKNFIGVTDELLGENSSVSSVGSTNIADASAVIMSGVANTANKNTPFVPSGKLENRNTYNDQEETIADRLQMVDYQKKSFTRFNGIRGTRQSVIHEFADEDLLEDNHGESSIARRKRGDVRRWNSHFAFENNEDQGYESQQSRRGNESFQSDDEGDDEREQEDQQGGEEDYEQVEKVPSKAIMKSQNNLAANEIGVNDSDQTDDEKGVEATFADAMKENGGNSVNRFLRSNQFKSFNSCVGNLPSISIHKPGNSSSSEKDEFDGSERSGNFEDEGNDTTPNQRSSMINIKSKHIVVEESIVIDSAQSDEIGVNAKQAMIEGKKGNDKRDRFKELDEKQKGQLRKLSFPQKKIPVEQKNGHSLQIHLKPQKSSQNSKKKQKQQKSDKFLESKGTSPSADDITPVGRGRRFFSHSGSE